MSPKKPIDNRRGTQFSIRLSAEAVRQLKELEKHWNENRSQTVSRALGEAMRAVIGAAKN